jgi:hypothetical protein
MDFSLESSPAAPLHAASALRAAPALVLTERRTGILEAAESDGNRLGTGCARGGAAGWRDVMLRPRELAPSCSSRAIPTLLVVLGVGLGARAVRWANFAERSRSSVHEMTRAESACLVARARATRAKPWYVVNS